MQKRLKNKKSSGGTVAPPVVDQLDELHIRRRLARGVNRVSKGGAKLPILVLVNVVAHMENQVHALVGDAAVRVEVAGGEVGARHDGEAHVADVTLLQGLEAACEEAGRRFRNWTDSDAYCGSVGSCVTQALLL